MIKTKLRVNMDNSCLYQKPYPPEYDFASYPADQCCNEPGFRKKSPTLCIIVIVPDQQLSHTELISITYHSHTLRLNTTKV